MYKGGRIIPGSDVQTRGGRMYKARGPDVRARVGCYDHWGRMYVDNFMFQQLFYRVVHLIPNYSRGAALTRNKGPYGAYFFASLNGMGGWEG